MDSRGLRPDGTIAREGSLSRVAPTFRPVVEAAGARIAATFGADRMHSAYLYGSVPRGTATPGVSDLDVLLVLREEPADSDHADAQAIENDLDAAFDQIDGAAIGLASAPNLLSERERFDGGFFVACLCTLLLGEDLAANLPRYRPTSLLARETNGDLHLLLPQWRESAGQIGTEADRGTLGRRVGRRLVRTAFTLVMPRWGGWTSDLRRAAEIAARYYPERSEQFRLAAATGLGSRADADVMRILLDDLGRWLVTEYEAVHGRKAPRA